MDILLKDVRLSFPRLFEPVQYEGKGAFRYDASFLIEPGSENDKLIWDAIKATSTEALGKKAAAFIEANKTNTNKFCYTDGDLKDYEGYEGLFALASHRRAEDGKPGIFDNVKDPLTGKFAVLSQSDGRPYAGCYVNAAVSIYTQSGTNPGVRASFTGIQFVRDGVAFSGAAPSSSETFDDLSVEVGADLT